MSSPLIFLIIPLPVFILAIGMFHISRILSLKKITAKKYILTLYMILIGLGISFIIEMQILWILVLGPPDEIKDLIVFLLIILITSGFFLSVYLTANRVLEKKETATKVSSAGGH